MSKHEEIWVKCEVCGKGFDNYPALVAHLYSHIAKETNRGTKKNEEFYCYKLKKKVELCPFSGKNFCCLDFVARISKCIGDLPLSELLKTLKG